MALKFEITSSLLPDHATVAAFQGSEGISRPYVFDVYVVVGGGDDVDVDEAPGARVTLTIGNGENGTPVRFSGMIATMELLRSVAVDGKSTHENSLYLVRIVPHLWQLSLTRHSRIWTKKTIPEVIQDVLEEEGIQDVELRLRGTYEVEEHVCQYKESSLNFIERWMEREGIYYFFEQTDSGELLIITDILSTSVPSRDNAIRYHSGGAADATAREHLDTFTWRNSATPAAIRFTDYDYNKPALDVVGKAAVSKLGVGEQVTYGNRFFTPKQGDTLAKVRADDLRARAKTYHGSGPVLGITSGYKFSVDEHPKAHLNTEYLAVTVDHSGYQHGASSWGKHIPVDSTDAYRAQVTAILGSQQYRHPETAIWPRLDGFENAIVDGPATSQYAQIDDHGRYNLKFKFDEGTLKGGKASTWVRKMQPHAGTVEGWHFPERSGTEVVCAFLGGDPDRPIIVGAVPTAIHPSPVNKGNHTKNVIQTGGKNRYEMEDLAGQQRVTISTPHQNTFLHLGFPLTGQNQVFTGEESGDIPDHHAAIVSDGNALIKTCGNQDINSGGNWHVQIANNHVETIGVNRVDEVGGYMEQTIGGKFDQDVTGPVSNEWHDTFTQDIKGTVTQHFKTDHSLTISGNQKVEVEGNHGWHCDGFWNHSIEGPRSETVAGMVQNVFLGIKSEFVGGMEAKQVIGVSMEMIGGAKIDMLAGLLIELKAVGKIDIGPEKIIVGEEVVTVEMMKSKIEGVEQKIGAEHSNIVAVKNAVEAMNNVTHAVANATYGAKIHRSGISSKMNGLDSAMNGLTSIT